MSDRTYKPPECLQNPHIQDFNQYSAMYQESIEDPEKFFGNEARKNLAWIEPFIKVHNNDFSEARWFEGGKLNIAYNCIDRHLAKNSEKIALIWEGDEPNQSAEISYSDLHKNVCKFANILKDIIME